MYHSLFSQNVKLAVFLLRAWVSEWVSECLFPAAPSLSVGSHHPPLFLFHLVYLFYLLAHSLTLPLSHSLTSCVSPFLFFVFFFFFLVLYFLSSVASSYSFEAYFLLCCRMWGGGGAWGVWLSCVRERKREWREGGREGGRVILSPIWFNTLLLFG